MMTPPSIRFNNGATYERYMGIWSRAVGESFLDWLAPPVGAHWLDVGCGNGAFTELLIARYAPSAVDGLDPSAEQLAYAREQPALRDVRFHQGDAMALPFPDNSVDAAVMPLVIFFVPDPAKGVAEMARVVRPGGSVSAYAWDLSGGGFPYAPLLFALRDRGITVPSPPSPEASNIPSLQALWQGAGLAQVETHAITVQRTFASFDDYWTTALGAPSASKALGDLPPDLAQELQVEMREKLHTLPDGRIACTARAHAVKGVVPR